MLSRVLPEALADAQPVAWRQGASIATNPGQPLPPGAPGEVLKLRARITEMNAAAEQQARQAYETGLRTGEGTARKALEADTRAAIDRLTATIVDVAAART